MFGWARARSSTRRTGDELYGRIVAQARTPGLYAVCGVPDTIDGRVEMLLLHTVLVLERLGTEGPAGRSLGQHLVEALVADLDDAMRQIGLGDDSIVHRMKRFPAVLAERRRDYGAALAAKAGAGPQDLAREALEAELLKHVFPSPAAPAAPPGAAALAAYVRRLDAAVKAQPAPDLLAGRIAFPPVTG